MKRRYLLLGLFLSMTLLADVLPIQVVSHTPLYAQETNRKKITLRILDEKNTPLNGAVVREVGFKNGAVADIDGYARLTVKVGSTIWITYTGMKDQRLKVTDDFHDRDIILQEESSTLGEVIATGYTTTTKKRTTGSVATIQKEALKFQAPNLSVDHMIKGQVAGVTINSISGRPGQSAKIQIRGVNSLSGKVEPLWVVDGVPIQSEVPKAANFIASGDVSSLFLNGIGSIPPGDIESISILKDASATAIYGSRAAGGVIVVTTKHGSEGNMKVSYSSNYTVVTAPPRSPDLMNAQEKITFEKELWDEFSAARKEKGLWYPAIGIVGHIRKGLGAYKDMTAEKREAAIEELANGPSTDWFKELFQNSFSQTHHLSLSGGTPKVLYYASLSYNKDNGLVKKTDAQSVTFNLKLDARPTNRIKLSLASDISYNDAHGAASQVNPFQYAYFANPYERPYNDDHSYREDLTWKGLNANHGYDDPYLAPFGFNIFRELNETSSVTKNVRGNLRGNLSLNFNDYLSFNGVAAVGYTNNLSDTKINEKSNTAFSDRPFEMNLKTKRLYGSIAQNAIQGFSYLLRGQVNYSQSFNRSHFISALFGSEIRSQYTKSIFSKRYGYDPVTGNHAHPPYPQMDTYKFDKIKKLVALFDKLSGQNILENTFASFYFTADYSYKNRYVLSFTGRTDGSNNFGSEHQFNPTSSLGFAWNMDEETFMKYLRPYISRLSLRLAGGYTGHVNRSASPHLIMKYLSTNRVLSERNYRQGNISVAPNDKLRWEKTRDAKVGMEMGLLNDRISLNVELYDRLTTDAISEVSVVSTTGYQNQTFNTSTILNRGIEMTLSSTLFKTNDWRVFASANLAINYNKLLSYKNPYSNYSYGQIEGYPYSPLFSGKIEGIDPILGIYTYRPQPGVDVSTPEKRKDPANYLYYLGTTIPPLNGGFMVNISYKKFAIGTSGSLSSGALVENQIQAITNYNSIMNKPAGIKEPVPGDINDLYAYHLNTTREAFNRWTPQNPIVTHRPRIIDRFGDILHLDKYMTDDTSITKAANLECVHYLKINSLYASYTLDAALLKKIGIESITTSLQANNLFVLTNYSGFDPETPGAVYPIPRTYTLGVSLSL